MNEELVTQESTTVNSDDTQNTAEESNNSEFVNEFIEEGSVSPIKLNEILINIRSGVYKVYSTEPVLVVNENDSTESCIYRIMYGTENTIYHVYTGETYKDIILQLYEDVTNSTEVEEPAVIPDVTPNVDTPTVETVVETEEEYNEIPVNSKTLLVDDTTSRFSSAIWYENIQNKTITLAGLGGIGSYVCFIIARMKPASMYIFDNDIVEEGNMSGQLYSMENIGELKVSAISDMIRNYAGYNTVFTIPEKFTWDSQPSDIMICGFDNMEARSTFYALWKKHVFNKTEKERANCLFIDGRLAAEEFQILCIKGDDDYNMTRYQSNFLFSDEEAEETVCSYKQTTFCANMIASYIVNLFVNFCANQCEPIIDRDLPFLTTYNAETMFLKTEV